MFFVAVIKFVECTHGACRLPDVTTARGTLKSTVSQVAVNPPVHSNRYDTLPVIPPRKSSGTGFANRVFGNKVNTLCPRKKQTPVKQNRIFAKFCINNVTSNCKLITKFQ